MLTFKFPGTGEQISRLGFGLMRLPRLGNGNIDRAAASALVDRAVAGGVNYFDTAYFYHNGESEDFAGEALAKYPRDSYYLASKLPASSLSCPADVPRIFEEQLRRCRTEYFDFYLLHALTRDTWRKAKNADALAQVLEYKKQGRVRHVGFSFHGDYETFIEILDAHPWEFVQIQINYVDDVLMNARALYDELVRRGIPIIVMEPMHGGGLARPPESAVELMRGVDASFSPAEWAFRWCLDLPGAAIILSGMNQMEQMEENVQIFSRHKPLPTGAHEMLGRAREEVLSIKRVPCTSCAYCMDCPSGVNIPALMQAYNKFKLFKHPFALAREYGVLAEKNQAATSCTKCGVCVPKCPQGIDIPTWMDTIDETVRTLRF